MDADKFLQKIDALYHSRLILAEPPIADLLKTLVSEPEYFDVLRLAANTYPYRKEFDKAVRMSKDGASFNLPVGKLQTISLVAGLLSQIDRRTLSLVDFVSLYYPEEDKNASYLDFLKAVVSPFRDAFLATLKGTDNAEQEEAEEKTDEPKLVAPQMRADISGWLQELKQLAIGANNLTELERIEILSLTDGMTHVSEAGNDSMLTLLFIGLKNTLFRYRVGMREISEIERILLKYGLLG